MEGNLSSYRIFYTVAQKGNISYAAKELFISQPAISKAISKLEESLSTELFFRSSRGVTLTESGKLLYEQTRKAFEALEEGERNLKKMQELGIGQIRIGVSTTLCKYILIPYLKKFITRYPHIKITISCQSTFHTVKLLEEDKIDIGLIGRYGFGKEIEFCSVQKIQDIFVAGKDYLRNLRLRENKDTEGLHLLESATFLLLDEKNISRRYIDRYFEENQTVPNQILEVGNMDLLIDFAKIGLGIACVIKEFVKEDLESGILIEIPIFKEMEKREIGFAYAKKKLKTEAMERFADFVNPMI